MQLLERDIIMVVKKRRLNVNVKKVIGVIVAITAIIVLFLMMDRSAVHFQKDCQVEIHSVFDYSKFITEVKGGNPSDVKIDSSQVQIDKIGEYELKYQYKSETGTVKVKVVDTTSPEVELKTLKIALNQELQPKDIVKKINDASKTTVSFQEEYDFDKEGKQKVIVVVEDEYGNKTEKEAVVEVVKDKTAPVITAGNQSILVGTKTDLKDLVTIQDDYDLHPTLDVEAKDFDYNKIGNYQVKYLAQDESGNKSEKTITVQVIDKTGANEKVVYLTFDDGPSKYTPEVLKILDQYNCKATFFITGMNANYRKYIKTAHDKGHTIGLHTYSHEYSKVYASVDAYFDDLEKVGNLAKEYIGYVPKYIRFPGGGSNTVSANYTKGIMTKLTKMVEEKGYIYYDWNAENGDGYSRMSQSEMIRRGTASEANQIMLLMHDANGKHDTVETLPKIIEHYQKKGYTFKAIDDSSMVPHQRVNN